MERKIKQRRLAIDSTKHLLDTVGKITADESPLGTVTQVNAASQIGMKVFVEVAAEHACTLAPRLLWSPIMRLARHATRIGSREPVRFSTSAVQKPPLPCGASAGWRGVRVVSMKRLMRWAAIALVLAVVPASRGAQAADDDEDPDAVDRAPGDDQTAAPAPAPSENRPPVWIVPPRRDSDERPPPVRLTIGLLFGTGYGWVEATGEVNRDVLIKGSGWAQLGHVAPELGFIFPRAHLLALLSFRYQKVTGTTDVYAGGQAYEAPSSASAYLAKFGFFPRAPRARVQPYLLLSTGLGAIIHTVRVNGVANCGPTMNQQCVDAVVGGGFFAGGGTGVRVRLSEYFDAVAGVDVLAGAVWNGMINIDFNVGVAFIDSVHPSPEWQKNPPRPSTN